MAVRRSSCLGNYVLAYLSCFTVCTVRRAYVIRVCLLHPSGLAVDASTISDIAKTERHSALRLACKSKVRDFYCKKKKRSNSSLKGITSFHVYVLLWLLHVAMLRVTHARNDVNCRWKLDKQTPSPKTYTCQLFAFTYFPLIRAKLFVCKTFRHVELRR